ncbi:epsin-1 [Monosporozyma servazzii]
MLRSAKNIVKGYSSTEVTVRDATANNSTMPSRDILEELADKSYNSSDFFEIMDMLDKRINDKGKYWRHVLKSLMVLDYLVRFGSENCVLWCKENLYIIKTLREFMHEDETGVDEGQVIRKRAKDLTSLLMDDERLKQERSLNKKNRGRRNNRSRGPSREDDEMRRAIEESRITAEEEEARRRRNNEENDDDRRMALQLSQEEQELKRLQELQRQQELLAQQQQQQQQQQQPQMYYDVFGNPITPEEYLQYQQQQALLAQQQQQALAQQQQQQYWAMQQQQAALLAQQQAQGQQQLYGIQQAGMTTGSNNPFARSNQQASAATTATTTPSMSVPSTANTTTSTTTQPPLKQTRTGDKSITDKYSALNTLLATGTGIDTFGNTGEQRIPAQHTQTGTFINSQGTGYRQVTDKDNANPFFIGTQYTGLPSSNIVPSQTGYGFGNSPNNNIQNKGNTLLDL